MTTALEKFEQTQLRTNIPQFRGGDTVRVHVKIKEGDKERIQIFEGTVIRLRRGSSHATFTVRKISSRCIHPLSRKSKSCALAGCVAPSSITCASSRARQPVSAERVLNRRE